MDNEQKLPSTQTSWRSYINTRLPVKLVLVIAFLCINALLSLIGAFLQAAQNMTAALFIGGSVLLYVIPAYGLFHVKRWAHLTQLTISLISFIQGIIQMLYGNLLGGMLNIVLHGLIAIYLLSDECRQLFRKPA